MVAIPRPLGINFSNPKYFHPATALVEALVAIDNTSTSRTSATTAFFTELARRGIQDTTNWTADTYKTILSISSGAGEVAAYIGCTAGGAETHTVEFTVDGGTPQTMTIAGLASGERGILISDARFASDYTGASGDYSGFTASEEALDADKATWGAVTNAIQMPIWRNLGRAPKLEFSRSLLIRAKHSASITNSTATAYSAVIYRNFLAA